MLQEIELIKAEIENYQIQDASALEAFRLRFLSKKGSLQLLLDKFKELSGEEKKSVGNQKLILKRELKY